MQQASDMTDMFSDSPSKNSLLPLESLSSIAGVRAILAKDAIKIESG
jgi:hypothetical protein